MKKIEYMRLIGKKLGNIIKEIKKEIKEGSSGLLLEKIAIDLMKKENVFSSCKNYRGFPSYICVSVNENLTHGIPNDKLFVFGDIISIDVCCFLRGRDKKKYHADSAFTKIVTSFDENKNNSLEIMEKKKLLDVTEGSLYFVIGKIIPGITSNLEIGEMIEEYVKKEGLEKLFVIEEYGGHGIGNHLHEKPFIPNYKNHNGKKEIIKKGMFICIEPLVQKGDKVVSLREDKWTVFSPNNFYNAHFEHTLYIDEEVEILTNYDDSKKK